MLNSLNCLPSRGHFDIMNIALIVYGKMGHAIEQAAQNRGHDIVLRITSSNRHEMKTGLQQADVAIEFTKPEAARDNVLACLAAGVNVVCGTTGWNDELPEVQHQAIAQGRALLQAANFSIGVNIFFEVNKLLARLMHGRPEYDVRIEETHHMHKKDAPSGTAIALAEQILERIDHKKTWSLNFMDNSDIVPIVAHRIDSVPGTHHVRYTSAIDDIELIHTAHNRDGFALGAVLAAEFIAGKSGIFTMKDVLGIN